MIKFLKENGKFDMSAIMKLAVKRARNEMALVKSMGFTTTWKKELSDALKKVWSEVKQVTAFARNSVVQITAEQYQAMKG